VSVELAALRAALERGEEPSPSGDVEVVRGQGGQLDHVRVTLAEPVNLAELADAFGTPTLLPPNPAGGRGAVFRDTQPGDGERGITVLAELDAAGRAVVVVLRPDDFRY
jgi:hypothetical protein